MTTTLKTFINLNLTIHECFKNVDKIFQYLYLTKFNQLYIEKIVIAKIQNSLFKFTHQTSSNTNFLFILF